MTLAVTAGFSGRPCQKRNPTDTADRPFLLWPTLFHGRIMAWLTQERKSGPSPSEVAEEAGEQALPCRASTGGRYLPRLSRFKTKDSRFLRFSALQILDKFPKRCPASRLKQKYKNKPVIDQNFCCSDQRRQLVPSDPRGPSAIPDEGRSAKI